ncbi:hypothetical protein SOPP22_12295 [Shewanella sp. OPT22]|nr:hypothetical protein SOPP22_12295 [Shewanella sp. OPT22]
MNTNLEDYSNDELKQISQDESVEPIWRRQADKVIAMREWKKRNTEETDYVVGCLERRGYKVTVTNKIVAENEDEKRVMYLSDSSLVMDDNDECISIDDFALWLDS